MVQCYNVMYLHSNKQILTLSAPSLLRYTFVDLKIVKQAPQPLPFPPGVEPQSY